MKFLHFFLLVVMVALASASIIENDSTVCKHPCFELPEEPICAHFQGKAITYFNECEVKCDNAEILHVDECTFQDMLDNRSS